MKLILYIQFVIISDTNECANDFLNGCNQICTNTIGSFLCECNNGYELGDDLMTCSGLYNNIMSHLKYICDNCISRHTENIYIHKKCVYKYNT